MSTGKPQDDARKYLAAFADGELDVEQNLRVLEYVKMHPEASDRVTHQQQLREAVRRCVCCHTPATPGDLCQQIEDCLPCCEPAQVADRAGRPDVLARLGWYGWVAAAAAVVALAIVLANQFADTRTAPAGGDSATPVQLPGKMVAGFERRHDACAGSIDRLMRDTLPQNLTELPTALAQRFEQPMSPTPGLDLTPLGYEFTGVGRCGVPGEGAVHLVYHPIDDPEPDHALSLWIKPYDGAPAIEPDRVYAATGQDAPHRILVWRKGNMIYYLAGPADLDSRPIAQSLASAR